MSDSFADEDLPDMETDVHGSNVEILLDSDVEELETVTAVEAHERDLMDITLNTTDDCIEVDSDIEIEGYHVQR